MGVMRLRHAFPVLAGLAIASLVGVADDEGTRMLWNTGLLQNRRPSSSSAPAKSVRYRSVAQSIPAIAASGNGGESVVGITFWRLRYARPDDDPSTRLLLLDEEGAEIEQVPERIEAGTPLKPGERVRLSVEVPSTGYLYIFDREQYSDKTSGAAHLIYPNYQTPPGEHAVAAGRLLEIPSRRDRITSFKVAKSGEKHVGEELVVLVTPKPLDDLDTTQRKAPMVDDARMAAWERQYSVKVEHFELVGGAGQPITAAEKRAGADPSQPLTRDEALPQSFYRVNVASGQPMLLKLPIRIAQ